MSKALTIIAENTGASVGEITEILRGMIVSAKNQHGAAATDAEVFIASSICAKYDLNPLMKEVAIFTTGGKLQVTIPIDGWIKILNRNPDFDGIEYEYGYKDDGSINYVEAVIHMKNRKYPTRVREFMDECVAMGGPTWKKCPARMLRNKATGQGTRVACGVTDVVDDDEAYRIKKAVGGERDITPTPQAPAVDLKALNDRMAQFASLDDLDAECKAIANELRASGQFDSVKGDLSLMRREHTDRINALDVLDVDFGEVIDGEQAE